MAHKLDIKLKVDPEVLVACSSFKMIFTIKNMDNVPFQGHISKLSVRYKSSSWDYEEGVFPLVGSINPQDSKTLTAIPSFASEEGLGWVYLQLRTGEGKTASHFKDDIDKGNEWTNALYFRNPVTPKLYRC